MLNTQMLEQIKRELFDSAKESRFSPINENMVEIRFTKNFVVFGYTYHAEIIGLTDKILIRDWIYTGKCTYKFSGFFASKDSEKTFNENVKNAICEYLNSGEIEKTFQILGGL